MSIRKVVGLLAGFALAVGLIGAGVGAQFTDQVTAKENINVGSFQCMIVAPSSGTIALDGKSVTYNAPDILSSAPGNAPFSFTVKNTGTMDAVLTVSTNPLGSPFTAMPLSPVLPLTLAAGASQTFAGGLSWGVLTDANLNQSGTLTYTVTCTDTYVPPVGG
jgi:hypothetical protein